MSADLAPALVGREALSETTPSDRATITSELRSANSAQKLSEVLPPLLFGTATLNYQFNVDPYALHPNTLVAAALASGIRGFDTSPYYGPAEEILGTALYSSEVKNHPSLRALRREDYYILTKAGRISGDVFDYSPSWIRHSVKRSLRRLKTTYLDVVYLHDVEFVSPTEVVTAIRALRDIRDTTGTIHYVGICGYPVDVLTSLAELILCETGESLDIVQSYANFTIQNQRLKTQGLQKLIDAGVDVVPNASPLGMGLLRRQGVPIGAMGNWHPAPDSLRSACLRAAKYVEEQHDEKLETVAVRFAMENWLSVGSGVGSRGPLPNETIIASSSLTSASNSTNGNPARLETRPKLGVNVMGISKLNELTETMDVYNSVIRSNPGTSASDSPNPTVDRKHQIRALSKYIRTHILGNQWTDHAWSSPDPGFTNQRKFFGVSAAEEHAETQAQAQTQVDIDTDADTETNPPTNANTPSDLSSSSDTPIQTPTLTHAPAEENILYEVVRHLHGLERGVPDDLDFDGDEKKTVNGVVQIGVEERAGDITPPSPAATTTT